MAEMKDNINEENVKAAEAEAAAAEEAAEKAEETVAEEAAEKAEETVAEEAAEKAEEPAAEEAAEKAEEPAAEEAAEKAEEPAAEDTAEKMLTSTENKRKKKAERREAKAARKAANKVEEKKSRPNNLLLGILIFGVLIGMFAFVAGYNYFSKPESIEKYIADNGGTESYSGLYVDEYSTADVTAEGNNIKLAITCTPDKENEEEVKEYYTSEEGEKQTKYIGAYFLTTMKPEVRGFSGNVSIVVTSNDEEITKIDMTYNEAKKFIKELEEEAEEESAEEESPEDTEDAEEASEDAAEDAEETSEDAAEEAEDAAEEAAEGSAESE